MEGNMVGNFFNWFRGLFFPASRSTPAREAKQEQDARLKTIQTAWRAYYGDMGKPLRVKIGQPDDNITLNFGKIIVDKGVSFLFGESVTFTVTGEAEQQQQAKLDAFWKWNRQQTLLHLAGLNGAVTGQVFIKIVMEEGLPFPRLVNLDPALVMPECDPNDYERILRYVIQWNSDSTRKEPLLQRQVIEPNGAGWVILDQSSDDGGKAWRVDLETAWPYPFSPIFQCQNLPAPNQLWGMPDLTPDILKLLHSRNFVASNMARILRYHAHPKTYAKGMTNTQKLEMGVDDIVYLPNPQADLGTLEMKGDLSSSLSFLMYLDENLQALANLPPIALGKMDASGPVSGVALRIRYQPMIQRVMTKRQLYGEMLTDLSEAALILMGFQGEAECEVVWPDPLPVNLPERAETGLLLDQLGVSKETLLTDLGYDWKQESERRAEESKVAANFAIRAFDSGNVPPNRNEPVGIEADA